MVFELFSALKGRHVPRVSVRSTHQIGLNEAAVKEFGLENVKFVQLYYDKENSLIGVKPIDSSTEPYAMSLRRRPTGADIAAKSFLDYYRIPREQTVVVDAHWDNENKMIILDLKNIRSQRSRSKKAKGG